MSAIEIPTGALHASTSDTTYSFLIRWVISQLSLGPDAKRLDYFDPTNPGWVAQNVYVEKTDEQPGSLESISYRDLRAVIMPGTSFYERGLRCIVLCYRHSFSLIPGHFTPKPQLQVVATIEDARGLCHLSLSGHKANRRLHYDDPDDYRSVLPAADATSLEAFVLNLLRAVQQRWPSLQLPDDLADIELR